MAGHAPVTLDERFRRLVDPTSRLENSDEGCFWAEGPAYFRAGRRHVGDDLPNGRVMPDDETSHPVSLFWRILFRQRRL